MFPQSLSVDSEASLGTRKCCMQLITSHDKKDCDGITNGYMYSLPASSGGRGHINMCFVDLIQSFACSFSLPASSGGGGHINMCSIDLIQSFVCSFSLPASSGGGGHINMCSVDLIQSFACSFSLPASSGEGGHINIKPFIYEPRESSLVPEGILGCQKPFPYLGILQQAFVWLCIPRWLDLLMTMGLLLFLFLLKELRDASVTSAS